MDILNDITKRLRTIDLILALLWVALASAQDQKVFGPLIVETPEGRFELRDFRLWEYSSLRPGLIGPRPSGLIENQTGTAWEKLELIVVVQCPGVPPKMIQIFLYDIGESESQRFKSSSSDADHFCNAERLEIRFDHGTNVRATERVAAEKQAEAAARQAVENATAAKRLAKEQEEENERHAVEVAAETTRLSAKMVALRVPKGHSVWAGVVDCRNALIWYGTQGKLSDSEIRDIGGLAQPYEPSRRAAVLSRADNCAVVRFIEEGRDLYIAASLVPLTQEERADAAAKAEKAVEAAKAQKDRADRAAALAKAHADREAQERAREAAEKAKLQAKCTAVFNATGNKKVSISQS